MKRFIYISILLLSSLGVFAQVGVTNKGTKIKMDNVNDTIYIHGYYNHDVGNLPITDASILLSGKLFISGAMLNASQYVFRNAETSVGKLIFKPFGSPFSIPTRKVPTGWTTNITAPIWGDSVNAPRLVVDIGTNKSLFAHYDNEVIKEIEFLNGRIYLGGSLLLYNSPFTIDSLKATITGEDETNYFYNSTSWAAPNVGLIELDWLGSPRPGDTKGLGVSLPSNISGSVKATRILGTPPQYGNDITRTINRAYYLEVGSFTPGTYTFSYLNREKPILGLSNKSQVFSNTTGAFPLNGYEGYITSKNTQSKNFSTDSLLLSNATKTVIAMGECKTAPRIDIQQTQITKCYPAQTPIIIDAEYNIAHQTNVTFQWYRNGEPIVPHGDSSKLNLPKAVVIADSITGTYAVVGIFSNGCFATDTIEVFANPQPETKFDLPTTAVPYCVGNEQFFDNKSTITKGAITQSFWQFDINDNTTKKTELVDGDGRYTYTNNSATKTYTIQLITESDSGCTDTLSKTHQIFSTPTAVIGTANGVAVCEDAWLNIQNNSTTADQANNPISVSDWNLGGIVTNRNGGNALDSMDLRYSNATNGNITKAITLIATTSNNCKDTTNTTLTIYPKPVATPAINLHASARLYKVCQDTGVGFSYSNPFNVNSTSWNFDNTNTNSVNSTKRAQTSPTGVLYQSSGTFTPRLIATSINNCTDSFNTSALTIYPLPNASFTALDDTLCYGTAHQFTDASSQPSGTNTFLWEYGNTASSTNGSHNYTYPQSGIFTVKLTAQTPFTCKDDTSKVVRVKPMPSVSFTTANKCEDSTVTFNSTAIGTPNGTLNSPTWHWDFVNGTTNANYNAQRSQEDPSVAYDQYGSYTPTVYVVAEKCTSSTANNSLVIHANPVADFSTSDNCGGDTAKFNNNSTLAQGAYTYVWNMGDGNTYNNQASVKHVYANTQNYQINFTATSDSGCIDKKQITYRVFDIPTALFDTTNATVCNLLNSQFTNQSSMKRGSALKYVWKFGEGNISTTKDPIHVYQNPNSYNVTLVALPVDTTNICRDSITKTVIIHPNPVTDFNHLDNCLNDTVTYNNQSTIAYTNMVKHYWDFGDGTKDTTTATSTRHHHYTNPGNYTISLKTESDKGCLIEKKDTISNYARPSANYDTSQASVCVFTTSKFTNQSVMSDGSAMTYSWDFFYNNNTDTSKNPTFKYPNIQANYNVKLNARPADTTNVCRDSVIKKIYIWKLPDSSFAATLDTFCFGKTTNFIKTNAEGQHKYQWHFGDGTADSSNSTFVSKEYGSPGAYSVTIKAESQYGCKSDSIIELYIIPTPNVNFTVQPDTLCLGNAIPFTNASDTVANSYVWNYGDNSVNDTNSSNTYHPSRIYSVSNSYLVELKGLRSFAGGKFSCESSVKKWAVVEPLPIVQFTVQRNSSQGKNFTFLNTSYLPNGVNGNLSYKWKYGNNDSSSNSLASHPYTYGLLGSYEVELKATSNFGCVTTKLDTIEAVSTPSSAFSLTDSVACGAKQFSFNNQSTSAQNYKWYFGDNSTDTASNPNHTYTSPGKYLVQLIASDTNGYSDTSSSLIVVNAQPQASFSATTVCAGTNISFTNSSSISNLEGLTYKWFFGDGDSSTLSTPTHVFDTGGTKTIQLIVVSDSGCVDTSSSLISIYHKPVSNFDSSSARVCVSDSSTLTSQATISVGSITSQWWKIQGDPTVYTAASFKKSFPTAKSYDVTLGVVSNNGCRDSITKKIFIDLLPQIALTDTQRTCGASLTLDAGNSGASYLWSNSDTNKTLNVTADGSYQVTVTLGSGCVASARTQIFLNTTVSPNLGSDFSVCGDTTLDAKNPGAAYIWNTSETTREINITSSGTYHVTVTDQNNCIGIDTIAIIRKSPPIVNLGSDTTECAGTPVTLNAGTSGDKYLWSNNDTSQTIQVSTLGTYIATATDTSTNCSTSDTVEVKFRYSPPVSLGIDQTICGSQPLLLNAGTFANVSYLWNDNSTNQTLTATSSGKYWAKVTDNVKGCSRTDSVDITINTIPTVNLGSARTVCSGASSNLSLTHYNGNKYLWSTSDTTSSINTTISGTYSVTVTDSNQCNGSGSVSLSVITVPEVKFGNDTTICQGKSLLLSPSSSGGSLLWSNNTNQSFLSVNQAGTYWATATSGACLSSDTITIATAASPVVNLGSQTSVCGSGNLNLDAGNWGGSYLWNSGDTTQVKTVNNSGLYSVTAIDSNGCSGSANAQITVHANPTYKLSNKSVCSGTPVFLNVGNSGSTYLWSNSNTQQAISVNQAGTYKVTVTNTGGCSIVDSSVVTVASPPTVSLGANRVLCSGQSVILDAQNVGSSYSWSNGDTTQTVNVATSGFYAVTVTDAGGCTSNDNLTVSLHGQPVVNLGGDKMGCTGDTINLKSLISYPSNYTYNWTGGATTNNLNATNTGNYVLQVTNNFSCAKTDTIGVTIQNPPTVSLGPDNTVCGDTLLDAGNPGATYVWNNNSSSKQITANQTGTFIVQVSVGGCSAKDTINLTVNTNPIVNLGNDITTCANTLPQLDAGNIGSKFLWSNSDTTQTINPSITGQYYVEVTNLQGCTGTDTVAINLTNGPIDSLGPDINICWDSNPITLNAGNTGSNYKWSTGSQAKTLSINKSGTYSVTITDPSNCSNTSLIDVTLKATPSVNLGADRSICDSTVLDPKNAGSTYLWQNSDTNRLFSIINSGVYHVAVTNLLGCTGSDTVSITIGDGPLVNLGNDTVVCSGRILNYKMDIPATQVLWSNSSTNDSLLIGSKGTYWVKVTDTAGCSNSDTITVSTGVLPVVNLGPDTTLCSNQLFPLEVDSGYAKYTWNGPNNYTDSTRSVNVTNSGSYKVVVESNDGCINQDSLLLTLTNDTVFAHFLMPSAAEIGDSVTMVDISSSNVTSWFYEFGDNTTSTDRDPLKRYFIEGKYDVKLTVSNSSCKDSETKSIEVKKVLKKEQDNGGPILPIDVIEIISGKVYPNPNAGQFNFELNLSDKDNFSLYFFDMRGVIVYQDNFFETAEFRKEFNFYGLAPGIYFLKVITLNEQSKTFKIVINN